jgi:L-cysteine S-thiosulfotransferase
LGFLHDSLTALRGVPPARLPADDVYALTAYMPDMDDGLTTLSPINPADTPLIANLQRQLWIPALAIAAVLCAPHSVSPVRAQSAAAEGQKIAFDRGKGNCLTCHDIRGGDLPGSIGPKLENIASKYPDRSDLVAILTDETKRNPLTVMPPFGRNRILTEREINAVVDFLQTL